MSIIFVSETYSILYLSQTLICDKDIVDCSSKKSLSNSVSKTTFLKTFPLCVEVMKYYLFIQCDTWIEQDISYKENCCQNYVIETKQIIFKEFFIEGENTARAYIL